MSNASARCSLPRNRQRGIVQELNNWLTDGFKPLNIMARTLRFSLYSFEILDVAGEGNVGPPVNITVSVKSQDEEEEDDHGDKEVNEWSISPSASWTSTGHVSIAVLLVFILSPVIICSNVLLLLAVYRFKRLRHPSNYFVASLASADMGVGFLLPAGLYFEFSRSQVRNVLLCLLPYCLFILLCSVSLLSMTAVAVDRCTSLAAPLRYNNIITHRSVLRYISMFCIYSLLLSSSPIFGWLLYSPPLSRMPSCSFSLVLPAIRIFLFSSLFAPCALFLVSSYCYVYAVARSHAQAIFSVELSFHQHPQQCSSGAHYGRTLAATVGFFLTLWLPFQVAMLANGCLSDEKITFYLGMLVLSNAAVNPWIYGYRSAEFRLASMRILHSVAPQLTANLVKPYIRRQSIPGGTSCASQGRFALTPNHGTADTMCATLIEIPANSNFLSPAVACAQV